MNTLFSIHDELMLVELFAKRQDVHLFFGGMPYYINNNANLPRITIDMKTQNVRYIILLILVQFQHLLFLCGKLQRRFEFRIYKSG